MAYRNDEGGSGRQHLIPHDILRGGYGGSIPANYDRFLRPFLFEPFAADIVKRLRRKPKMRVLEVACGTGVVTERLRQALAPGDELVATDLQAAMLECAMERIGSAGADWQQADAMALPFGDASFDAIVCQFGWMFFPDKARCAKEARRVLRSGGQLLFNVWDSLERNGPVAIFQATLDSALGDQAPGFLRIAYGYAQPDSIRNMLRDAGFVSVEVTPLELPASSPSAEDVASGYLLGTPVFNEVEKVRPESLPAIRADCMRAVAQRYGHGPLKATLSAFVCSAIAP